LKARGFKARATAILFALRNVTILAARLARRAGLSRRSSAHTRALAGPSDLLKMAAAAQLTLSHDGALVHADTS
jgi:hypothetical protein